MIKKASKKSSKKTTAQKIEKHDAWKRDLDLFFGLHAIEHEDKVKCGNIRKAARTFARAIYKNCPNSADRNAAIRKVREAVMTANASIACQRK